MVTIHNMESCVFYKQPEDIYILYYKILYYNTTIYSMAISNSPPYNNLKYRKFKFKISDKFRNCLI